VKAEQPPQIAPPAVVAVLRPHMVALPLTVPATVTVPATYTPPDSLPLRI
jgi:hypothetical protein